MRIGVQVRVWEWACSNVHVSNIILSENPKESRQWLSICSGNRISVGRVSHGGQCGNGIVSGRRTREQRIRNSFHHIVIKRFPFIVSTTSFDATVAQRRNNSRRQFRSLLERSEHILNIWTLAVNSNYLCCLEFNGWHFKNCFLNVYKVSHMKSKYNSISLGSDFVYNNVNMSVYLAKP